MSPTKIAISNSAVIEELSNLWYKPHQISRRKCFSSRLAVAFAQSIEARCWVENVEDVVGAMPTGDTPTTSKW